MVDCVWLSCLTYVIGWMSRVKASFKYLSILITEVGKQSSFLLLSFFFVYTFFLFFFYGVCLLSVFVLLHW